LDQWHEVLLCLASTRHSIIPTDRTVYCSSSLAATEAYPA
jgi:hypothetical protein